MCMLDYIEIVQRGYRVERQEMFKSAVLFFKIYRPIYRGNLKYRPVLAPSDQMGLISPGQNLLLCACYRPRVPFVLNLDIPCYIYIYICVSHQFV